MYFHLEFLNQLKITAPSSSLIGVNLSPKSVEKKVSGVHNKVSLVVQNLYHIFSFILQLGN